MRTSVSKNGRFIAKSCTWRRRTGYAREADFPKASAKAVAAVAGLRVAQCTARTIPIPFSPVAAAVFFNSRSA